MCQIESDFLIFCATLWQRPPGRWKAKVCSLFDFRGWGLVCPNTEIPTHKSGLPSIIGSALIEVAWMTTAWMTTAFRRTYWKMSSRMEPRPGHPFLLFKNSDKTDLRSASRWKSAVHGGVEKVEEERITSLQQEIVEQRPTYGTAASFFICLTCFKDCHSRIFILGHQNSCNTRTYLDERQRTTTTTTNVCCLLQNSGPKTFRNWFQFYW